MPYIAIDLGTTNCVLSFGQDDSRGIEIFDVPQLIAPREVGKRDSLPSFIYLATDEERRTGDLKMPWDPFGERVIGEYARKRGTEVKGRLISSAKSWLSVASIDRTMPILPIDAPQDCQRLSPVVASASLLRHLKAAWNLEMGKDTGEIQDSNLIITIPASFDAVARDLTVQAARSAGLDNVTLLEEPQAAFYAWLFEHRDEWQDIIAPGDIVLVVDIGGGTTDFTLIRAILTKEGALGLERIAVGPHLLLGGDNMDIALTEFILSQMEEKYKKIGQKQYNLICQNVRMAKETIFEDMGRDDVSFTIPLGRGAGLVSSSIPCVLKRDAVHKIALEGFFPECSLGDTPADDTLSGLTEFSLPYERDSAITRHLSHFLTVNETVTPTHILFNGGVLKAGPVSRRLFDIVNGWVREKRGEPLRELKLNDLDTSVANGGVAFLYAKTGELCRIKGGLSRSYYIGLEKGGPAIPGLQPRLMALCIAPKGAEEGETFSIEDRRFGLLVGKLVSFPFMASTARDEDMPGDIVENASIGSIDHISSIETVMEAPDLTEGTLIPVRLKTVITEVGTIEIYLVSEEMGMSFKMEFGVRDRN